MDITRLQHHELAIAYFSDCTDQCLFPTIKKSCTEMLPIYAKSESFTEKVYELAFGEDAINKGYSESEVLERLKAFAENSLDLVTAAEYLIEEVGEDFDKDYNPHAAPVELLKYAIANSKIGGI